jgi:hypothetical protein
MYILKILSKSSNWNVSLNELSKFPDKAADKTDRFMRCHSRVDFGKVLP